jgi:ubiquinone/menaquinone biosynthesis C-methylase UbiE
MSTPVPTQIREIVRDKYAARARDVAEPGTGCCEPSCCQPSAGKTDPVTSDLYTADDVAGLPEDAVRISLGCGNPTALAQLHPGETVLDLGSGGGIDVLLSARRVGPTGFAYGLDMTDEMLALAEKNKRESGLTNVQFLKGHIEQIPLPENTVDVIISNCVINLSSDKAAVLKEAFRVLKPGGRFAVSDVVAQGELPDDLRKDMQAWVGCVAGALEETEYRRLLADAGFGEVEVQVTRVYDPRELAESLEAYADAGDSCCGPAKNWDASAYARYEAAGGRLMSGFVRATKP